MDTIALTALAELLRDRRTIVVAGAGCSTESGIPDYRGPDAPLQPRKPIQYQEFVRDETARTRYWARSSIGWLRMRAARPNPAHYALARLESDGAVCGLITQNVDGLHRAAGSRDMIELHGSLDRVRCMACTTTTSRDVFQEHLLSLNEGWGERLADDTAASAESAPDGDVELPTMLDGFRVPGCAACGGIMKPDVVFFGENVPAERVQRAWQLYEQADVLLVVGSSLTVFSGRRFIYRAQKEGVPVAVVNIGPTRADDIAALKVEGRVGLVLPRLAETLAAEKVARL